MLRATSLGESPHRWCAHHIICGLPQLHLREAQPRSFVPKEWEMMFSRSCEATFRSETTLTLRSNDVVPCGTNEKIQVFRLGFFGSPCWVSAVKRCRWHVFTSGVRQSASRARQEHESKLCDTRLGPERTGDSLRSKRSLGRCPSGGSEKRRVKSEKVKSRMLTHSGLLGS